MESDRRGGLVGLVAHRLLDDALDSPGVLVSQHGVLRDSRTIRLQPSSGVFDFSFTLAAIAFPCEMAPEPSLSGPASGAASDQAVSGSSGLGLGLNRGHSRVNLTRGAINFAAKASPTAT